MNVFIENSEGKTFPGQILPVDFAELVTIEQSGQWIFKWEEERDREIVKIALDGYLGEPLGLMAYKAINGFVEISLLEIEKLSIGAGGRYQNLAGLLFSFACLISEDKGYEGYVMFISKTQLKRHYIDSYGAQILFGDRLFFDKGASEKLQKIYLKR